MNDVILSKKVRLEKCIKQIHKYYKLSVDIPFKTNWLIQDAIALNMQRACELCIDIANVTVKEKKLGLPASSKNSFQLLEEAGMIDHQLCKNLCNMVGFRNVLVHSYEKLNVDLMETIITTDKLDDLIHFADKMLTLS
ncbi:MAG: DUF86 domain-containing protein [Caldisericia bacterium]|nr:DUF86 domain-containing protein [Caldisericia bacterium]